MGVLWRGVSHWVVVIALTLSALGASATIVLRVQVGTISTALTELLILATQPADGTLAADPATQLSARFDRAVTFAPGWSITLTRGGVTEQTFSATSGGAILAGDQLTLTPSAPLRRNASYAVSIAPASLSAPGTVQSATLGWSFSTAGCALSSTSDAGSGSLRELISDAGCDSIALTAPLTIQLTSGPLTIARDVIVNGDVGSDGTADLTLRGRSTGGAEDFAPLQVSGGTVQLRGVALTGGRSTGHGGGLLVTGGTVALSDCAITGNVATGDGGGIAVRGGSLSIARCDLASNTAGQQGGGLAAVAPAGTITLVNSSVRLNVAGGMGGGLSVENSNLDVASVTIDGNTAALHGGGLRHAGTGSARPTLSWSGGRASNNATASLAANAAWGGGLYLSQIDGTLTGVDVTGNRSAGSAGGGLSIERTVLAMGPGLISGNRSFDRGGGLMVNDASTATLTDVTVRNNEGMERGGGGITVQASSNLTAVRLNLTANLACNVGGGMLVDGDSQLTWTGGEARDNRGGTGGHIAFNASSKPQRLSGLALSGGRAEVKSCGGTTTSGQGGSLRINGPTVTVEDVGFADGVASTATGGLGGHLFAFGGTTTLRRVSLAGGRAFGGGSIYVGGGATVALDDATLTDGVATDSGGHLQVVAGGVATIDRSAISGARGATGGAIRSNGTVTIRDSTLSDSRATGWGGHAFAGGGTLTLDRVTLTGGRAVNGASIAATDTALSIVSSTLLDGAVSDTVNNVGGHIFTYRTSAATALTVTGSRLSGGVAGNGGALYAQDTSATLTDTELSGNSVYTSGGGAFLFGGSLTATRLTVTGNTQSGNSGGGGGGLTIQGGAPATLTDSTVTSNTGNFGGGIQLGVAGDVALRQSRVEGNNSGVTGGGIYADRTNVTLVQTNLRNNSSVQQGGGLYLQGAPTTVGNAIAWVPATLSMLGGEVSGNVATNQHGGGLRLLGVTGSIRANGATPALISGNTARFEGGGVSIIDSTITIDGITIRDNVSTATDGSGGGGGLMVATNIVPMGPTSVVSVRNTQIFGNQAGVTRGGVGIANSNVSFEAVRVFGNRLTQPRAGTPGHGLHRSGTSGTLTWVGNANYVFDNPPGAATAATNCSVEGTVGGATGTNGCNVTPP